MKLRWNFSQRAHPIHTIGPKTHVLECFGPFRYCTKVNADRVGVPDLSVSGDKFDLVEDDPHDPTMTSELEAPMQSLNQLPVVTNLVDARSA
jgi:hypothetical protein